MERDGESHSGRVAFGPAAHALGAAAARSSQSDGSVKGLEEDGKGRAHRCTECREAVHRRGGFPPFDLAHVGPVEARTGGKLLLGQSRLRSAEVSEALAHGPVECLGFLVHCCETLGRCTIGSDTIEVAFWAWMMAAAAAVLGMRRRGGWWWSRLRFLRSRVTLATTILTAQ